MSGGQNLSHAFRRSFRLLVHGELVAENRLVFVHPAFHMPASEVSAIRREKVPAPNPPTGAPCQ